MRSLYITMTIVNAIVTTFHIIKTKVVETEEKVNVAVTTFVVIRAAVTKAQLL